VLQKHASLRGTLCPPGQSKKAIGPESPIGPCIATPGVDNRPACCFRKRWRRHKQRNGTTGENNRISVSHAETKQNPLPGEDHSQSKRLRSNGWAECRDKKGPAPSRGGKICLDIPSNRTYRFPDEPGVDHLVLMASSQKAHAQAAICVLLGRILVGVKSGLVLLLRYFPA